MQEHLVDVAASAHRDAEPVADPVGWSLADAIGFVTKFTTKDDLLKNKPHDMDADMWEEIDVVYDLCQQFGTDANVIHEKLIAHFDGEKVEVGPSQSSQLPGLDSLIESSLACKDVSSQEFGQMAQEVTPYDPSSGGHEPQLETREAVADFLEKHEDSQPTEEMIDRRMAMMSHAKHDKNMDTFETIPFIDLVDEDYTPLELQAMEPEVPAALETSEVSDTPEMPQEVPAMPEVSGTPEMPQEVPATPETSQEPGVMPAMSEVPDILPEGGDIPSCQGVQVPFNVEEPHPWRSPPSLTAMDSVESLPDPIAASVEEAIHAVKKIWMIHIFCLQCMHAITKHGLHCRNGTLIFSINMRAIWLHLWNITQLPLQESEPPSKPPSKPPSRSERIARASIESCRQETVHGPYAFIISLQCRSKK